jgi:hypothetical protein
MWQQLSVRNRLTIDELNTSFRRGIVRRIKSEKGDGAAGMPTFQGIEMQWRLLRNHIGEIWKDWLPEQKALVCDSLRPIVEFYRQLGGGEGNYLA